MTMLLQPYPESPPPIDFLLARVRCLRSRIDVSGKGEAWPGQLTEEGLLKAVQWLYRRLPPVAGRRLHPYFELLGGRSLVMALRLHRAEDWDGLGRVLQQSLLHVELCTLFRRAETAEQLLTQLDAALVPDYPELQGLAKAYAKQGPGGAEERIAAGLLQRTVRTAATPALRHLVARLVDLRNVLSIGKYWRWQMTRDPQLSFGGTVAPERLRRVWNSRDETGLAQLVVRLARQAGPPPQDAREMELMLLKGITVEMRQFGKDPLGVDVLLDYLWRCQVAARNRALAKAQAEQVEPFFDELKVVA